MSTNTVLTPGWGFQKSLLKTLFFFLFSFPLLSADSAFESTKNLPVSYQGRFRSLDSTSRLWLYDTYHQQQLKKADLKAFHTDQTSAMDLLWNIHFFGHNPWKDSPFFWIHYAKVKSLLDLKSKVDRFSFQELYGQLYNNETINLASLKLLILSEFAKNHRSASNRSYSDKIELTHLSPGLWITLRNDTLAVIKAPATAPWNYLKPGMILSENAAFDLKKSSENKNPVDSLMQILQQLHLFAEYSGSSSQAQEAFETAFNDLAHQGYPPHEIAQILETRFPFHQRLQALGTTLKMLPTKFSSGEWVSLHAFNIKIYDPIKKHLVHSNNFTSFTDQHFLLLRKVYRELEHAVLSHQPQAVIKEAASQFSHHYQMAYASLAETPYRQAQEKSLSYPSFLRLQAETLYYRLPLIEATLIAYAVALIFLAASSSVLKSPRLATLTIISVVTGFIIHTLVLILRSYILQRPPVSNMFETIVYVPWIAVALGLIFYKFTKSQHILAAAALASFALLILLKLTQVDSRLENVQAVLDSQYWLIIHVLMVVGSYGAFVVCGILGHFYLVSFLFRQRENASSEKIARGILHTMYVGIALLIPGTILGGIWAAESWGRFWDWDPKESWAFISACVYLLFVHAYTFHHIRDFGLAIGSIAGLIAISFTWYGVNYVLGTGLHSYGFGSGGELFYFLYVAAECLFILSVILLKNKTKNSLKKIE